MLRLLGFITFLALTVLVIGLFAGWFSFFDSDAGTQKNVTIRIDKEEMGKDLADAKRKITEAVSGPAEERITGDLLAADAATREIELRREEGREIIRLKVAVNAAITVDGAEASLVELRAGDRVEVHVTDEPKSVTRVVAKREE